MTESQFRPCRKTFLPILFVLLILTCLPIAGWGQSAESPQDEEKAPQNIAFRDASLKAALATMGKQLKINVVYDDAVKDIRLSIELKDVTIKAAMKIILIQQHLQARLIEDKTILIFPDNEITGSVTRKIKPGRANRKNRFPPTFAEIG